MISKVVTGKNFHGCCRYICEDKTRAVVLKVEGVRNYNHKSMAHDFEINRQQLPSKRTAVFHGILSFYPGESLTDAKLTAIAEEYLNKIGMVNTQYAITKHVDTNHLHLHLVANMVNNAGKAISDSWIGYRGKKAAQELTHKHQLVPADKKDLSKTNLEALDAEESIRYEIFQAIKAALPLCKALYDLEKFLRKRDIDIQYKFKTGTQEICGISFKKDHYAFKGSSIDRRYSFIGLQKVIQQNKCKKVSMPKRGLRH